MEWFGRFHRSGRTLLPPIQRSFWAGSERFAALRTCWNLPVWWISSAGAIRQRGKKWHVRQIPPRV